MLLQSVLLVEGVAVAGRDIVEGNPARYQANSGDNGEPEPSDGLGQVEGGVLCVGTVETVETV